MLRTIEKVFTQCGTSDINSVIFYLMNLFLLNNKYGPSLLITELYYTFALYLARLSYGLCTLYFIWLWNNFTTSPEPKKQLSVTSNGWDVTVGGAAFIYRRPRTFHFGTGAYILLVNHMIPS